jgi:Oxygenase domain of the 2OGFeDO superfamily
MIEKKEKKGGVTIYYVKKDYDDNELSKVIGTKLKRKDIPNIIHEDADVITEDGTILLRFRINKLKKENMDPFYTNIIKFAMTKTSNRGTASASESKNLGSNTKIMSNIIGYFDKLSPAHKFKIKKSGKNLPKITVRETRFLQEHPDKFEKLIPLINEIDYYYKKYVPENYEKQKKKANQTPFHIANTSFTTVTTNVNFQTAVHTDKGDDAEGFGNLTVLGNGKYKGGETCFPQYGIGIDIQPGDIAFMDVHQAHGNLPIVLESKDAIRLSIVCYLRHNIWKQTKGKTKKMMIKHNQSMKRLFGK